MPIRFLRRRPSALVAASLVATTLARASAQSPAPYATVFYPNGSLRLEAYLYTPRGSGPFPLVIYNHGSRAGSERTEQPFVFIGRLLTGAGYAVLVPERRGYGKSEGQPFSEEIGKDKGAKFIARQQAEADDVIAALDYAKTVASLDTTHAAVVGWSFGGIVTVFAAGKASRFVAVVDQAGGSLSWKGSPALQQALPAAAAGITVPMLCLVAENDATTAAVTGVYDAARSHGRPATLVVYPAFTPPRNPGNTPPGHLIFGAQGVSIWQKDVLSFLARYLTRSRP